MHDDQQADQLAALGRRLVALGQGLGPRCDVDRALATTRCADLATSAAIAELTRLVDLLETGGAATPAPVCGSHGVHFSRSHDHTVAAIIEMFDDARAVGRPAVVVATRVHRRWIEADLHQRCIAFEGDVCRLLDAEATLASLLVDGEPDRGRFRSVVGGLLSDMCARHPGGVSVYGEMVGLLWTAGNFTAAMRLEELWTELQRELPFTLLCGYHIDGSPAHADLDPIRHAHTYVA